MRKPMPLQFPVKGVVENAPYSQQPPGTTPDALNVRSFDSLERRNRGGQRIGLSKLSDSEINSGNQIQLLEQIVRALDLVQTAGWGDKLTDPAGPLAGNFAKVVWASDGSFVIHSSPGNGIRIWPVSGTTFGAGITLAEATIDSALGSGSVTDIALSADDAYLFLASTAGLGVCTIDPVSGFGAITEFGTLTNVNDVTVTPDNNAVIYGTNTAPYVFAVAWTGTAFGSAFAAPSSAPAGGIQYVDISADGTLLMASSGGVLYAYEFSSSTGFGVLYDTQSVSSPNAISIHPGGIAVAVSRSNTFYQVFPFSTSTGFGTVQSASAGVGTLRSMRFSPTGAYLFCGGISSPYGSVFPYTNDVGTVLANPGTLPTSTPYDGAWSPDEEILALAVSASFQTWDFQKAGVNPTARETRVVAVSGGSVYRSSVDLSTFTLVANGSTAYDATNPAPMGDTAFQKLFIVDGIYANYQYLDFADNTLKDWAGAITDGALPQGTTDTTLGCRILAVYRGRVVLSGLKEEPQNWFMSRAGDPFDFDYSPTTPDATQAVAGNNSEVGELGDIVTALAPYQDDLMVMGGANSVWVMRGDPAAGGQIDNIVRGIGIVGPHAWCFDDVGNFYFFAVNGLYRIGAGLGTQPELISKNKLDTAFADLDVSAQYLRLEYDPIWQGVHVFNVSEAQPANDTAAPMHYFWDARNDGFWPDQYPAAMGPTATLYFSDDNPERSGVILGGWDSFVRQFDDDAADDDGTAITSRVQFPAENPGLAMADSKLSEIHINLDRQSDDVTLNVYAGQTVEDAVRDSNLRFSKTLVAGKNNAIRQRARGAAIVFELEQSTSDSTWAYENGLVIFETQGKTRRRRQ